MNISPARTAAFDVLERIEENSEFSSVLLPIYEDKLETRDRALCHEIVLGVLRNRIYLDRIIDDFAANRKLDHAVRISCQIGLYQLLFLTRVPAHSIVNESVNLVVRAKKTSAKGFVNAFLRGASKQKPEFEFTDEIDRISVQHSHPRWLIEKWSLQFGIERAESIAASNNQQPAIAFRLTRSTNDTDRLLFEKYPRSEWVEGCFLADKSTPDLISLGNAGRILFQDEASQLVGRSIVVSGNGPIIDLCAAPGGKFGQISMLNPRSTVFAADRSRKRIDTMSESLRNQGLGQTNIIQFDATQLLPFADCSFEIVFVDAPCSGTGTIRHNPEIRYLLQPDAIAQKAVKQLQILEMASKVVRSGGALHYSTCSLEKEENENVVNAFLASYTEFEIAVPNIPDRFITKEGFGRTFPDRDNMDGFFISVLKRL
jgi:16S rRNA (cytosine967-C5)-methyltransferase